jgi:hypothetical protein
MELHDETGDRSWLDAAYRAVDQAKRTQFLDSSNPGLRGGLPGADPLWGHYNHGVILSWSAKFFIDALLRKAVIEGRS